MYRLTTDCGGFFSSFFCYHASVSRQIIIKMRLSVLGIKKVVGCLLVFWCFNSFAGFMGSECIGQNIHLPCENEKWHLSGEALYLQVPSWAKGLDAYQDQDLVWRYGFQFKATLDYRNGHDLNVEWYHFRTQAIQNLKTPKSFYSAGLMSQAQPYDSLLVNQSNISFKPAWDQINIEFGQNILLGDSDEARFYGGFNYSRVVNSHLASWVGQSALNNIVTNFNNRETSSATYNGFGLRSGMHLAHFWLRNFKIYTQVAISILAGTSKSSISWNEVVNSASYTGHDSVSHHLIVPELDGQIGISYRYRMTQGDLNAHIAWLWLHYFSALGITKNNFATQGANFGLQWTGDFI
jgi:hypothetical protein